MLCQVLTQKVVSIRILGQSKQAQVPTHVIVFATGNNLRIIGDATRRAIVCSLDPGVEFSRDIDIERFRRDPSAFRRAPLINAISRKFSQPSGVWFSVREARERSAAIPETKLGNVRGQTGSEISRWAARKRSWASNLLNDFAAGSAANPQPDSERQAGIDFAGKVMAGSRGRCFDHSGLPRAAKIADQRAAAAGTWIPGRRGRG